MKVIIEQLQYLSLSELEELQRVLTNTVLLRRKRALLIKKLNDAPNPYDHKGPEMNQTY